MDRLRAGGGAGQGRRAAEAAALSLLLLCPAPGLAQRVGEAGLSAALEDGRVRAALDVLERDSESAADLLVRLGGIISPSKAEHDRARAVADEMRSIGLRNVRLDDTPNVVGVIPGRSGRALVFVSTLDDLTTVAALQRAAGPPHITPERVTGPGTNTSATTVAMLAAARSRAGCPT